MFNCSADSLDPQGAVYAEAAAMVRRYVAEFESAGALVADVQHSTPSAEQMNALNGCACAAPRGIGVAERSRSHSRRVRTLA
jgi:hypothetical protein